MRQALVASFVGLIALASPVDAREAKSASAPQVAAIRDAMQEKLKDADSAKFRNVQIAPSSEGMSTICGQVNAKNSYGAYGGYKTFFAQYLPATKERKAVAIVMSIQEDDSPVAAMMCEKYGIPQS